MPRGKVAFTLNQRIAAFHRKVQESPTGCWLWQGDKANLGYGYLTSWAGGVRRRWRAHRFAWEIFRGPIPAGMCVCHHCDVPSCVNPEHLFIGTKGDNIRDMTAKGRHGRTGAKGERNSQAKITAADAALIRHLHRNSVRVAVLAESFGISKDMIYRIVRGQNWT